MDNREARRVALADWLMEFSVLWAVFPLLDQLLENKTVDVSVLAWGLGISLTTGLAGLILRTGDRK